MSDISLEEQLTERINTQLDLCDSNDTPIICGMLGDYEARQKLVALIVKKVVVGKMQISEAIIAVDNEYNPNSTDQ